MSVAPTLQNLRIVRKKRQSGKQEQGASEAAWKLAKKVFKFKEHERVTFFSSPENRCLPASTLTPEERICCRLRSVNGHEQQKGPE